MTVPEIVLPPLPMPTAPESTSIRDLLFHKQAWILFNIKTGKVLKCSPKAEELFGYDREELIGLMAEDLMPPALRQAHPQHRQQFADDPRDRPMSGGEALAGRMKDGREFSVQIDLFKFQESFYADYCLALVRDVTRVPMNPSAGMTHGRRPGEMS